MPQPKIQTAISKLKIAVIRTSPPPLKHLRANHPGRHKAHINNARPTTPVVMKTWKNALWAV